MPNFRSSHQFVTRNGRPRWVRLTATLLIGGVLPLASAQNAAVPQEPDWSLGTSSENAPISLEDDLLAPTPPATPPPPPTPPAPTLDPAPATTADPAPDPTPDPAPVPTDPTLALPTEPLAAPETDEPVISPAPEELNPDFFATPAPPSASAADGPSADATRQENSEALLTDPVPDEESTASVAAAQSTELFRMEGLKFKILGADLRFSLNTRFTYNDNILTSDTDPISDYVTLITPTIVIGFGDVELEEDNYFLLDYAPTFQRYATNTELDTVDQFFAVRGRYNLSRFSFLPSFRYVKQTDTDDEIGRRNERTTLAASLSTQYALSGKSALQADLTAAAYDSELGVSNDVYSLGTYFVYQLTERTELQFGGSVGYVDIETGDSQTFQTLTGRLRYQGTEKLTYGATLGAENRQSTTTVFSQSVVETGDPLAPFALETEENEETNNELTPIFELSLQYQPFDSTSLNLSAFRRVSASSNTPGQIVNSTGIQFQASQRVIQRVFVELLTRYSFDEYEYRSIDDRQDNIIIFQPRIRYAFHDDDYSVSLFYTYRENQSSLQSVSYTNSILGLELNFDF